MSSLTQTDLGDFLRASLQHFQDSRDFGVQSDVNEIERMLVRRIEEIEGAAALRSQDGSV